MDTIIQSFHNKLIVSCQAEGDSPFNDPSFIVAFARAAEMGGAGGVRICGFNNVKVVRKAVSLPLIGLTKSTYPDGRVLITSQLEDAFKLQQLGADMIAVDGTNRARSKFANGTELIKELKKNSINLVMADIATVEDALAAEAAGADLVGTTLSGFTPETEGTSDGPDFELLEALAGRISIPVIAEGGVWSPEQARKALSLGAYAVVVGTAITRPIDIVKRYVSTMKSP